MVVDPDIVFSESSIDEVTAKSESKSNKKPACDYCKRRKIKCDGQVDCFQCHKRALKCTYEGPAPIAKSGVISQLTLKLTRLASELEEHKKMAKYWQSLYEAKEAKKTQVKSTNHWKKPVFSRRSSDFTYNVASAVSSIMKAFVSAMKPLMPCNTMEYCVEYSMMLWNRLINSNPEEFSRKIDVISIESVIPLLNHSSMFAIGCLLIQYNDLAQHFHWISETIISALRSQWHRNTNADLARHFALAQLHTLFYDILSSDYNSMYLHWARCKDSLLQIDTQRDKTLVNELVLWTAVFAPNEAEDRESWLNKLLVLDSRELTFLRNITLSHIGLTNLEAGASPVAASRQWMNINSLETSLNRLRDSVYYKFLAVWIYGLKALGASTLPHNQNASDEVSQCVNIVAQLYAQISNQAQQLWTCRYFEYFYHVLSSKQAQSDTNKYYKHMLDVIYNIIIMITPPGEQGYEVYESYRNKSEFDNSYLEHPMVQNSPLSLGFNYNAIGPDLMNC